MGLPDDVSRGPPPGVVVRRTSRVKSRRTQEVETQSRSVVGFLDSFGRERTEEMECPLPRTGGVEGGWYWRVVFN